jgi:hypothetical protein
VAKTTLLFMSRPRINTPTLSRTLSPFLTAPPSSMTCPQTDANPVLCTTIDSQHEGVIPRVLTPSEVLITSHLLQRHLVLFSTASSQSNPPRAPFSSTPSSVLYGLCSPPHTVVFLFLIPSFFLLFLFSSSLPSS